MIQSRDSIPGSPHSAHTIIAIPFNSEPTESGLQFQNLIYSEYDFYYTPFLQDGIQIACL